MNLNESIVEDAALEWFGALGYAVGHGPQLAPGEHAGGTLTPALSQRERESYGGVVQFRFARTLTPALSQKERESYGEVVLVRRLREAIRRLNPAIPEEAREEALRKVLRVGTPSLTQTNRAFHRMLRDGIPVEFIQPEPSPQPSPTGRGRSEAKGEGFEEFFLKMCL